MGRRLTRWSLGLALATTACGQGRESVVLRMTSWQSPEENALDRPAIEAFEKAHPGVRVVNEPVSNQAEYREKVITNIASGSPPDVLLLDGIDVPAFVDSDVLLDLTTFAPRVGIDLRWYYPNVLDMFARSGHVYALPKGFSPMVIYYNRAMFDRAHVTYPRDSWTFDEYAQTAQALTRDTNGDGTTDEWGAVLLRPFYTWQAFVWSGGGDILTPDGRHATGALDSPATDSALSFLTGLVVRQRVAPKPNAFRAVTGNETRLFYSGKLAMLPSGHWLIPNIKRELALGHLRLGVTSTPRAPTAFPSTPLFASGWAVPRNTAHRKLAMELAAALAGPAAQKSRLEAGLELSTIPAVQEAFASRDTLGLESAFLRQVPFGRPPWGARIARYREVEALLPDIIDRVVIRGEDVHAVTSDVARKVDAVLAR
ncbi:MAG: sugar ABC transporter substrate-binding protein [Gemmatimonadaceae bacterium]